MPTVALRPFPKFKAVDSAGNALAGGKLYTYQAGTSTDLATYTTAAGTVANTNPVILDANGEADVWYQASQYKLVLKDSDDVQQWEVDNFNGSNLVITEALDEIKGADIASATTVDLSAATGNFVHITGTTTITGFTLDIGAERVVVFDGILTLTHNATSLIIPGNQNIITAAGDRAIIRGESTGNVRVIAYIRAGAAVPNQAKGSDIASAGTVNLDNATGDFVHITGTTTITAITLASGHERTVVFDGSLTLTHNATTLILPDAANIKTAAGDRAVFRGDGSGNVRCISYERYVRKGSDVASAATVNLDNATGDFVHITGTTTITAITLASGREATVIFDGALTLTHNATTLILPGAANITTAAGDRATFRGDGAGNTRCIHYTKADGKVITVTGIGDHEVVVTTGNGHGSTNTCIRRFTTIQRNVGTAITYADSAADGASFTINDTAIYALYYIDTRPAGTGAHVGISLNSAQLTTDIGTITAADRLTYDEQIDIGAIIGRSRTLKLTAGDVVRPHTNGTPDGAAANYGVFAIAKVGYA